MEAHIEELLSQYRSLKGTFSSMADGIPKRLEEFFAEAGIIVAAVEHRVKTEESLKGKLALKGGKYKDIFDITDLVGIRVITFYIDDVDKVASVLERLFEIDWENSIDKRKVHEIDSFGYLSLHYICRIPESSWHDPAYPDLNKIRFEVQMRTVLQHAWANMNHDTGYKSGVEIPKVYLRNLSRLAGMLELVDDEFSRIRRELSDYRRRVQNLVASGNLSEVAPELSFDRAFRRPYQENRLYQPGGGPKRGPLPLPSASEGNGHGYARGRRAAYPGLLGRRLPDCLFPDRADRSRYSFRFGGPAGYLHRVYT